MKVIFNLFLILLLLVLGYFVYAYYMNRKTPVDPKESGDAFRKPVASPVDLVDDGSFISLDSYILAGEISVCPDHDDHFHIDGDDHTHEDVEGTHVENVAVLAHDINTTGDNEDIPDPTTIKDVLDWQETPDMMNSTNTAIPVIGSINFETEVIETGELVEVDDGELDWETVTEIEIGNQALSRVELSELQKSLREAKMRAEQEE